MSSISPGHLTLNRSRTASVQQHADCVVDALLASLPRSETLSADGRRGIIARYTAVLEGNFIYWMTGAYISVESPEARATILLNLREELSDCHPEMLRRFAIAAGAIPTASDALEVQSDLRKVRLFIGRLSNLPIVAMMAFFEGFIQRFMPYLAELARVQGSLEQEYTEVHGVCDIAHTQELYGALEAEIATAAGAPETVDLFEGVNLLQALIQKIIAGRPETAPVEIGTTGGA